MAIIWRKTAFLAMATHILKVIILNNSKTVCLTNTNLKDVKVQYSYRNVSLQRPFAQQASKNQLIRKTEVGFVIYIIIRRTYNDFQFSEIPFGFPSRVLSDVIRITVVQQLLCLFEHLIQNEFYGKQNAHKCRKTL